MDPDDRASTAAKVADRLREMGSLAETIELAPGATLRPESFDPALIEALGPAGQLVDGDAVVRLGRTIGEGGMGVVREGVQVSLGRRVAVKMLREKDAATERAVRKLVHEARVTGALEHPNVVPVHDIARSPEGTPLIVLKRIDGVAWSELLRDPERLRREHKASDPLEWHLRVLLQVCNAVHFAHTRGVLHRDLKPDNVMIGGFGEVYVLDWGLAVRLGGEATEPREEPGKGLVLAGTPWYMAPEMLAGSTGRLSVATDVYLLGGLLHEIVTGRPPHHELTLQAILASALRSAPRLDDEVPEELAAIVRRALDPDPARRFASAEAFRAEIEGFLRHRGAVQLADSAERSLEALEAALANEGAPRDEIDRRFAEARFGFHAALHAWPSSARAKAGLERAVSRMVAHELAADRPHAAASLLSELEAPPVALARQVERAVRDWEARKEALLRLDRDRDPSFGRGLRLAFFVFCGGLWTIAPVLAPRLDPDYAKSHTMMAVQPVVLAILVGAAVYALRDRVMGTAFNRRVLVAFLLSQYAEAAAFLGGGASGMSVAQCQNTISLVAGCLVAMLATMLSRALLVPAFAYAVAFAVGAMFPEWRSVGESAANATMTATAIALWGGIVGRAEPTAEPSPD